MNLVSDTKSRKLASVSCLMIISVGISSKVIVILLVTLIGGWVKSIPVLIIAQFVQGFGTSSILSLSYAFLSDFCSDQFKPRAVIIVNTAFIIIIQESINCVIRRVLSCGTLMVGFSPLHYTCAFDHHYCPVPILLTLISVYSYAPE